MEEIISDLVATSTLKESRINQLKVASVIEVILLNEMQQLCYIFFFLFSSKHSYYPY